MKHWQHVPQQTVHWDPEHPTLAEPQLVLIPLLQAERLTSLLAGFGDEASESGPASANVAKTSIAKQKDRIELKRRMLTIGLGGEDSCDFSDVLLNQKVDDANQEKERMVEIAVPGGQCYTIDFLLSLLRGHGTKFGSWCLESRHEAWSVLHVTVSGTSPVRDIFEQHKLDPTCLITRSGHVRMGRKSNRIDSKKVANVFRVANFCSYLKFSASVSSLHVTLERLSINKRLEAPQYQKTPKSQWNHDDSKSNQISVFQRAYQDR